MARRVHDEKLLTPFSVPYELEQILAACPSFTVAGTVDQLVELSGRDQRSGYHEVSYDVPGWGRVVERWFAACAMG